MVVFICNGCGQSLKKAQVDTHGSTCKKCQSVSCLDCSKEFWGEDYKSHLKCLTENEKYGGKNFKPKIAAGEVKQEKWTKKIQEVIENRRKENPRMALILQQMKNYDNIPRTKPKFVKFAQNSLHILNNPLIEQVWNLFMDSTDKLVESTAGENGMPQKEESNSISETNGNSKKKKKKSKNKAVDASVELNDRIVENENNTNSNSQKKKKKKSKKESVDDSIQLNDRIVENENNINGNSQKKKKKSKKESVDDSIELNDQTVGNITEPNNKNKRKIENTNDVEDLAEAIETPTNKEKRRKKNKEHTGIENGVATMEENIEKEILPIEDSDVKLSIAETVLDVLQHTSNNELSLKKLRKKVLAKLVSKNSEDKSEKKFLAKLNKKLKKMSNIKIEDERIYLISN